MEEYIIFGYRQVIIGIYNDLTDSVVTQIILNKNQVQKANEILGLDENEPDYMCCSYDITLEQCDQARIWIPKYYRNKNFVYLFELDF